MKAQRKKTEDKNREETRKKKERVKDKELIYEAERNIKMTEKQSH